MTINYHHSRKPKNFLNRKVSEALPEYYTQDYPQLVSFLENYYEHLDSSGEHSFGNQLRQGFDLRDIHTSNEINNIIYEIGNRLPNGENFTDPRYAATRLAELQRNKGTRFSAEEFFRLFYQDKVEIEYPKKDIFTIGESQIGPGSLKFIKNAELYQIFSILIKTGLATNVWSELYKKFAHPAGFFFGARITSDTEALGLTTAQGFINDVDLGQLTLAVEATGNVIAPFTEMTGLYDSGGEGTNDFRIDLRELISTYQDITIENLNKLYTSVAQIASPNSFKFDNSTTGDSAGDPGIDFSVTTETMDNEMFSNYLNDSSSI